MPGYVRSLPATPVTTKVGSVGTQACMAKWPKAQTGPSGKIMARNLGNALLPPSLRPVPRTRLMKEIWAVREKIRASG